MCAPMFPPRKPQVPVPRGDHFLEVLKQFEWFYVAEQKRWCRIDLRNRTHKWFTVQPGRTHIPQVERRS